MQQSISEHFIHPLKVATQANWTTIQHTFSSIERITALHWETTKAMLDQASSSDTASVQSMTARLDFNQAMLDQLARYGTQAGIIAHSIQSGYLEALNQQWCALTTYMTQIPAAATTITPKSVGPTNKQTT
ncbi:hypothetical protein [Burkholderia territorii]|nr:hypothetical protein [Burkholderia territorii]